MPGELGARSRAECSCEGYRSSDPSEWGSYCAFGNPLTIRDPFTNQVRPIIPGEMIHCDHIFPTKLITGLSGFHELTREQQAAVLNLTENFQPLPGSLNCSKGCELANTWARFAKQNKGLHPDYRQSLAKKQDEIRERLKQMIESFLLQNNLLARSCQQSAITDTLLSNRNSIAGNSSASLVV